jgi:hypothetical protein
MPVSAWGKAGAGAGMWLLSVLGLALLVALLALWVGPRSGWRMEWVVLLAVVSGLSCLAE